ncbi:DUF4244 domain-containing protein [Kitasatospora sp. NPDC057541]|uniref:DUF4244 domain-containing protein n=1 Tax=unclassified Kitasatospora TaxID=2633591 RepID=UPI0036AE52CE
MNVAIKTVAVAVVAPVTASGGPAHRIAGAIRHRVRHQVRHRIRARSGSDAGMTTAEYAVGTLGACALAAGLYKVATSTAVLEALAGVLDRALHAA